MLKSELNADKLVLGESPVWDPNQCRWIFTDISTSRLFAADLDLNVYRLGLDEPITNIVLGAQPNEYLLTTDKSLILWRDGITNTIKTIDHPAFMRCNDGSVGPDGYYYFGTMEKTPSGCNGALYSLSPSGDLAVVGEGIGIPNSFIWLDEYYVLISDSYTRTVYKVRLQRSGDLAWSKRSVWIEMSHSGGTPDGGAIDGEGNVWLSIWGSGVVRKYCQAGRQIQELPLGALQPTSCAFGGENLDKLLITTATEKMSESQLNAYPNSGDVLQLSNCTRGVLPYRFRYEQQRC